MQWFPSLFRPLGFLGFGLRSVSRLVGRSVGRVGAGLNAMVSKLVSAFGLPRYRLVGRSVETIKNLVKLIYVSDVY
jgi:hypothetical protein